MKRGRFFVMANAITVVRIACSAALLFCPVFSAAFYALYVAAGISDVLDGAVARKTDTVSAFGSKLDSAADLTLVAACMVRLLPVLRIPRWLAVWIVVIAVIRAINLVSGYVVRKEIVALHTAANKATGILLFLLPLTLTVIDPKYSGAAVCALATFAAIQEGHRIRTGA